MNYNSKEIEAIIEKFLIEEKGPQRVVIEAMNYAIRTGGKRLRPMLMKLSYDMMGGEGSIVEPFMAAIEMIHTYSLVHDDLPALDNDELRRGNPTTHIKFGEDIAILAGDALLNYAFQVAMTAFSLKTGDEDVEKAMQLLVSKPGIFGMIGGQTLDVISEGKEISKEDVEFIYKNKTAALIECSLMIGACLAGASNEEVEAFSEVGEAIGMAFQVQDDILDIIGDEDVFGKPIKSDDKNQKATYVSLYGLEKSKEYVKDMSKKALDILESIDVKDKNSKEALIALIDWLINRNI